MGCHGLLSSQFFDKRETCSSIRMAAVELSLFRELCERTASISTTSPLSFRNGGWKQLVRSIPQNSYLCIRVRYAVSQAGTHNVLRLGAYSSVLVRYRKTTRTSVACPALLHPRTLPQNDGLQVCGSNRTFNRGFCLLRELALQGLFTSQQGYLPRPPQGGSKRPRNAAQQSTAVQHYLQ